MTEVLQTIASVALTVAFLWVTIRIGEPHRGDE